MRKAALWLWCLSCLLALPAAAERYSVPGLGTLQLEMPKDWRVRTQAGPSSLTLQASPQTGDAFSLQITATWLNADQRAALERAPVRKRVEDMASALLREAVESNAALVELKGSQLAGYYFSLTARKVPQGEYRHLTQGMLADDDTVVVFTLLQRERDPAESRRALQLVAGAARTSDASPPLALEQDAVRISEHPNRYELWLPASRIYVVLPRGRLAPVAPQPGGATASPRYFAFSDRGFNVSGWFEPAEKFASLEAFWQREMQSWTKQGLPHPANVVFENVGGWQVIAYEWPLRGATNSHVRAHWVQDGTWIDLHVSLSSTRPSAEVRSALETYLQGVLVRER